MKVSPKYLIVLAIAVFTVAIWFVLPYCLDVLSGGDPTTSQPHAGNSGIKIAPAEVQEFTYAIDFIYPTDSTRDPFVQTSVPVVSAQVTSSGKKPDISLTGIIWNDENPLAIITDIRKKSHIMRTGDELDGAMIIAVHIRSVIIEVNGQQQELTLWPENFGDQAN